MKKSFCDKCGVEISSKNSYSMNGLDFELECMVFSIKPPDAIPMDFDICKHCVIDSVIKIDDRDKEYHG